MAHVTLKLGKDALIYGYLMKKGTLIYDKYVLIFGVDTLKHGKYLEKCVISWIYLKRCVNLWFLYRY